jgi:adenine deaminase
LPGLIDSYGHIENSMQTPGAFSMVCVPHGTIGIVFDPHEIANVLGMEGIEYMISEGNKVPVKFWFGATSCVPAKEFESTGASLVADIDMT